MEKHVQLLSKREQKILKLLADGCTYATISKQLKIPEPEVKEQVCHMLQKQGFVSSYQLIHWAYQEAVIS